MNSNIKAWPNVNKRGGFIGALSELQVAIDLLSKGFEVYRNICSFGSVDLIAYREDNLIIAIEVTTGSYNEERQSRTFEKHKKHIKRIDILAVYYFDGIIYYESDGNDWEKEIDIEQWLRPNPS